MNRIFIAIFTRVRFNDSTIALHAGRGAMKQLSFPFEEQQPLELCDKDILPETYVMYRRGGKHPFYGVPNTHPSYQELIWPYIKRIHYPENRTREERSASGMALCLI